ncbi:uncharacterized protein [Dermacentor albipictus]|uniref:uncharacterized protein isoform X2 n=1 Tax=Dermacentor albipictus TaxID=60249 RepID=UPI0038FC36E1
MDGRVNLRFPAVARRSILDDFPVAHGRNSGATNGRAKFRFPSDKNKPHKVDMVVSYRHLSGEDDAGLSCVITGLRVWATLWPTVRARPARTLPWLVVRTSLGQTAGSRTTSPWFMVRTAGGPTAGPSSVSQVTRTFPWLMKQTTGRRTAWPVSRFSAYKIDMVTRPSSTMVSDSSPSEPGGQLFYKPDVLIPALPNWWTADIAKCPVDMVAI